MNGKKNYIMMYATFLIYSLAIVCSKMVFQQQLLSCAFFLFFLAVFVLLFLYALLWQQVLKDRPLFSAYANKAVVILFGMAWGKIFFGETITLNMIIGAIVIMMGIKLVAGDGNE